MSEDTANKLLQAPRAPRAPEQWRHASHVLLHNTFVVI